VAGYAKIKGIALLSIFLSAAYLVFSKPNVRQTQVIENKAISSYLETIEGFSEMTRHALPGEVSRTLKLDDYAGISYLKENRRVDLYIGIYNTAQKVNLNHSPLVCFPGQGWEIDSPDMQSLSFADFTVNYAATIAKQGPTRHLVMYWYQAYNKTTAHSFVQKLQAFYWDFTHNKGQNAFVRITVPLHGIEADQARSLGHDFIENFYPHLVRYMEKDRAQRRAEE